jgi:hypothetical protein
MNLNNLGITYFRQGEFAQARDEQLRSLQVFEQLGSAWGVAMVRTDLADAHIQLNEFGVARELLEHVLADRWAARDDKAVAAALRTWATIDLEQDELEHASKGLMAAVVLSAPLSDRLGQGRALELLVLATATVDNHDLIGRASGALDAYRAYTGVRTAPWLDERIQRAQQTAEQSDGEFASRRASARDTAQGDLVSLVTALGDAVTEVTIDDVVAELLHP